MDLLRAFRTFVRVADEGSFAQAARSLDNDPAVVTRLVAELEDHLGVRLVHRTTRRMTITPIGEEFLVQARQIVADVDDACAMADVAARETRGHLRVLAPPAFASHQLAKHLPRFRRQYPLVTIEIATRGGVEAVDESFDVTLLHTRHALTGNFVARRLARTEAVLCASPAYLDRRGRPEHPHDLRLHDTLLPPISELQRGVVFEPLDPAAGEPLRVVPKQPVLATVHIDTNFASVLHGLGVAGLPSFVIEDALNKGQLERVLPAWRLFSYTVWAATPTRKHLPARTRAFLEFLIQTFGGEDRDPWLAGTAAPH